MSDREKLMELINKGVEIHTDGYQRKIAAAETIADHLLANGVTVQRWIPVEERLPELPDENFCSVYVNALYLDTEKVVPRLLSRSIVRGKRVERWHYPSGSLAKAPDFWMPLPGAEGSI